MVKKSEKKKPDNPEIEKAWDASKKFYEEIMKNPENRLYIHDGQPGTGKTVSLAKFLKENPQKMAFFSANHDHLEKFKENLISEGIDRKKIIHLKGFSKLCKRYPKRTKPEEEKDWTDDERYVAYLYKNSKAGIIGSLCKNCIENDCCEYLNQANPEDFDISLQPLEYLKKVNPQERDIIVVDESIGKNDLLSWDFSKTKIEYLKKYLAKGEVDQLADNLSKINQRLLIQVSAIFNKPPEDLFKSSKDGFSELYGDEFFTKSEDVVFHAETMQLISVIPEGIRPQITRIYRDLIRWKKQPAPFMDKIDDQIKNAIENSNQDKIREIFENYVHISDCFQFLMTLQVKKPSGGIGVIVSEKLVLKKESEIEKEKCVVIKEPEAPENYEWGFIDEKPYVKDKESKKYIVSEIGKEYKQISKNKNKPEQKNVSRNKGKDAWLTVGHPFLFTVFDISQEKPVILLDATYNERLFKKLRLQWLIIHSCEFEFKHPHNSLSKMAEEVLPNYRTDKISKIDTPFVSNENSIVHHFSGLHSGTSLDDGELDRIMAFIVRVIEENPGKTFGIVCRDPDEPELKKLLIKKIGIPNVDDRVVHYFNQRGTTIDCDILFLVGTPYTGYHSYIFDHILMLNEYPKSTEKKSVKFKGYKDRDLQMFFDMKVMDEIYQGLHRNRMLLYNRTVYAICLLPDKVRKEATIKKDRLIPTYSDPMWALLNVIGNEEGRTKKEVYDKAKGIIVFKENKHLLQNTFDEALKKKYMRISKEKTSTKPKSRYYLKKRGRDYLKSFDSK